MFPNHWNRRNRPAGLLAGFLLVAACSGETESPDPVAEPEYDGLSREQIEMQAEPMTPAEAERLGIVDTTIRIEPPISPESVAPVAPPEP